MDGWEGEKGHFLEQDQEEVPSARLQTAPLRHIWALAISQDREDPGWRPFHLLSSPTKEHLTFTQTFQVGIVASGAEMP